MREGVGHGLLAGAGVPPCPAKRPRRGAAAHGSVGLWTLCRNGVVRRRRAPSRRPLPRPSALPPPSLRRPARTSPRRRAAASPEGTRGLRAAARGRAIARAITAHARDQRRWSIFAKRSAAERMRFARAEPGDPAMWGAVLARRRCSANRIVRGLRRCGLGGRRFCRIGGHGSCAAASGADGRPGRPPARPDDGQKWLAPRHDHRVQACRGADHRVPIASLQSRGSSFGSQPEDPRRHPRLPDSMPAPGPARPASC